MSNYDEIVQIRLTSDQKKKLKTDADEVGLKLSDFIRHQLFPNEKSPVALAARVDTLSRAMESLPGGTDALAAAERATAIINRKDNHE